MVKYLTINPPAERPAERIIGYFDRAEQVAAGLRGVNREPEDLFDKTLRTGRAKYENPPDKMQ